MIEAHDRAILLRAAALEEAAERRYREHQQETSDPRLFAFWEGLRRNESEHGRALGAALAAPSARPWAIDAPVDDDLVPADGTAGGAAGDDTALTRLQSDLEFEREAVVLYGAFSKELHDPTLTDMMRAFARAEAGHVHGLKAMIARVERDDWPAVVFCPVCGWEIDLGPRPAAGDIITCPMCSRRFAVRHVGTVPGVGLELVSD